MPIEASVQPKGNSSFLNVESEKEESEDELDILFFDDKGEKEIEN